MALVVENGTGLSNADSYVSVADAVIYIDKFYPDSDFTDKSQAIKEAALLRATQYLDGKYETLFNGTRLLDTQTLAWPREGATYQDGIEIAENVVPLEVKNAVCELAYRASSGELEADVTKEDRAIRQTVDVITVVYAPGTSTTSVYKSVLTILHRLIGSTKYAQIRRT